MSKKGKNIITISVLISCLIAYGLHSCKNKNDNDYRQYMTTDFTYSDSNFEEECFVTFEDIVVNKWYALEIEENGKRDVIITQKTSYDKIPNGTEGYYYKNVLNKEDKVYLVFYNPQEDAISVETGPDIISAVSLADYLQEYGIAKYHYTKKEIEAIRDVIEEKFNTKKDFNKDGVLVKERHHY